MNMKQSFLHKATKLGRFVNKPHKPSIQQTEIVVNNATSESVTKNITLIHDKFLS